MCTVSFVFSALYAKCPYHVVLYIQRVLIMHCFICKVSLLCTVIMQSHSGGRARRCHRQLQRSRRVSPCRLDSAPDGVHPTRNLVLPDLEVRLYHSSCADEFRTRHFAFFRGAGKQYALHSLRPPRLVFEAKAVK